MRTCRQAIYGRFASGSHRESRRLQRARDFFNILLVICGMTELHKMTMAEKKRDDLLIETLNPDMG